MIFTLLALLVLVISHELGHFLAAKKFGVKVLEFGFGLPPKIFGKKYGDTIFSLNLLPIGGFVRLLGEDEVKKEYLEREDSFAAKPVSQRIIIVLAGVFVNLVLAWVLFYIVLIAQDFKIIYPSLEPVIVVSDVQSDLPAQKAGIKVGDRVMASNIEELVSFIKQNPGKKVSLSVSDIDGGSQKTVEVIPDKVEGEGKIGVAFSPVPFKTYNTPLEKIFSAPMYSWDLTKLTFTGLGQLITNLTQGQFHQASQSVSGPVGLVQITSQITQNGWAATIPYLWFLGVLSLTLTIFNSLPLPALDGGRAFFMFIEGVTKKKISPQIERSIHTAGMVGLLFLMALVTYSDLRKIFF